MPLRVYNTLTRRKEPFETVEPGRVRMYVCGPTVYGPAHVGHAFHATPTAAAAAPSTAETSQASVLRPRRLDLPAVTALALSVAVLRGTGISVRTSGLLGTLGLPDEPSAGTD